MKRKPEPIIFPNPPDETTARRIEETAEQVQEEFPYRTLLDCRELAARLVDAVLTWDAIWPEAEGDCACPDDDTNMHRPGCSLLNAGPVTS